MIAVCMRGCTGVNVHNVVAAQVRKPDSAGNPWMRPV